MSFKKIKGFLGYKVSDSGKVINAKGEEVKPRKDDDGYDRVDLYKDGKRSTKFVHSLVNGAHNGESALKEVDHKNRNRTDNRASNLRPATRKQQVKNSKR